MLTKEQILEILPQRDPFLFVDSITELVPGERVTGIKTVLGTEDFFRGHFPNKPVMPGVLIIETMAQIGAIGVLSIPENKGKIAYFTGIKEAKFKKMVIPGDTLIITCELSKMRFNYGFGVAKAYVNNELVCEATLGMFLGE